MYVDVQEHRVGQRDAHDGERIGEPQPDRPALREAEHGVERDEQVRRVPHAERQREHHQNALKPPERAPTLHQQRPNPKMQRRRRAVADQLEDFE
jgi:hypothetical protein